MPDDDNRSDEELLAQLAAELADAVERALPGWVERAVGTIADAWEPGLAERLADQASAAGLRAVDEVGPQVRRLLEQDVDAQAAGPLSVLRAAVAYPTEVLTGAGVPPVERDDFLVKAFPEDRYGLAPASFADIDPALQEPGIVWGAAKAHVVLSRRRSEGLR